MNIQQINNKIVDAFRNIKALARKYPRGTTLTIIAALLVGGMGIESLCNKNSASTYRSTFTHSMPHAGTMHTYNKTTGYYTPTYSNNSLGSYNNYPYPTPQANIHDLLGFARQEAAWQQKELQNSIYEMAAEQTRETERRIMEKRINSGFYTPKL